MVQGSPTTSAALRRGASVRVRRGLFRAAQFILLPVIAAARVVHFGANALRYKLALRLRFDGRPDDVFVVTYPKAGTTLLQQMLHQITTDGDMRMAHINSVAPWFETTLTRNPRFLDVMNSPRIFKSHLPFKHLPNEGRFIYCVRNPKDSCLSYFYHATSLHNDRSTLEVFVRRFLKGKVAWGSWFEHFRACFPHRHEKRVLYLQYEDLRRDLPAAVDAVSSFLGLDLDEAKKASVVERCDIAFMREHSSKFDPRLSTLGDISHNRRSEFIRKGAVGDWRNELTSDLSELIDARLDKALRSVGRKTDLTDEDLRFLKSSRSTHRATVAVRCSLESGNRFVGSESHDLSIGGMKLAERVEGVATDDEVVVHLTHPADDAGSSSPLSCPARVVWTGEQDTDGMGLRFLDPTPEFLQLVEELVRYHPNLVEE